MFHWLCGHFLFTTITLILIHFVYKLFDDWTLFKKCRKLSCKMLLNKRKNKCGLKSHPFKQLGTGTWGLIKAWELNYSGKYGTFNFKMGCNLSCFFKLCIGLLKFVQELWCYLVSCTVLTIPDLEDLWENMEWSKFIVIISLILFGFFYF